MDDSYCNSEIYIVEKEEALGKSLKAFFETSGYNVHLYAAAEDFIKKYNDDNPSCILSNVHLNGLSGMELQKIMIKKYNHIPVILMTDQGDISMAIEALKNGAFDFIEKPLDTDKLLACIKRALSQCKISLKEKTVKGCYLMLFQNLSKREKEVFSLMAEGYTNKVMAQKLGIAIGTVEAHRAKIMSKLKCNSLAEILKIKKLLD